MLANVLFTYELARRLEGSGVTANCLHPGVVRSAFGQDASGPMRLFITMLRPFMIGPAEGAETSIYLASSPEVEGVSGRYFVRRQALKSSGRSYDQASAKQLWTVSEAMTQASAPT